MATVLTATPTIAELLAQLGDIPAHRVLARPYPGTATEQDVADIRAREKRLCELVDGVLVEKAMGFLEAELAMVLGTFLTLFVRQHDRGIVVGADGAVRLMPGLVRIPDVCFVSWDRLPGRQRPQQPIPDLVPDLAAEVLSESNTPREMERKLTEYFSAGVRLVWYVDPRARTVHVYHSADDPTVLGEDRVLDGGDVLPGFALPLRELFPRRD